MTIKVADQQIFFILVSYPPQTFLPISNTPTFTYPSQTTISFFFTSSITYLFQLHRYCILTCNFAMSSTAALASNSTASTQMSAKDICNAGDGTLMTPPGTLTMPSDNAWASENLAPKKRTEVATTWSQMLRMWPYQTFAIVIMEFAITVTKIGSVLNLYYSHVLGFSQDSTVALISATAIISGLIRLGGSVLSDSYLGKFWAMVLGGCIYIAGKLLFTTATFFSPGPPHPYIDLAATIVILVGSSLMPIAPFAGDQFEPHQEKMISVFFSFFYVTFNIANIASSFFMPVFRAMPCRGQDSCYPLSFSISTGGVIFAFAIFLVGSCFYVKLPPQENVFKAVYTVIQTARHNKARANQEQNREHWLEFYMDTHNCDDDPQCLELREEEGHPTLCQKEQFLGDLRCLLNMLVILIPMPVFWALYDQQLTVWMNQALQMDGRLWGDYLLLPDQMQVVNPVLIISLVCLTQSLIYPLAERCVTLTPLRKMVAGGLIASLAFLVSGNVQLMVNPTLPDVPLQNQAFVSVVNAFEHCALNVTNSGVLRTVPPNSSLVNDKTRELDQLFRVDYGVTHWTFQPEGADCQIRNSSTKKEEHISTSVNSPMNFLTIGPAGAFLATADSSKPTGGAGQFKIGVVLAFNDSDSSSNDPSFLAFCRVGAKCNNQAGKDFYMFPSKKRHEDDNAETIPVTERTEFVLGEGIATAYPFIEVSPGSWKLHYVLNKEKPDWQMPEDKLLVKAVGDNHSDVQFHKREQGGVYVLILTGSQHWPRITVHQVVPHNTVSILWQLPQLFIIALAEVLFGIPLLEFSYSQAGPSMKVLAAALTGFTGSLGNLLIIILAKLPIDNLATKAFICSGAMLLDVFVIAALAKRYKYRSVDGDKNTPPTLDSTMTSALTKSTRIAQDIDNDGGGGL